MSGPVAASGWRCFVGSWVPHPQIGPLLLAARCKPRGKEWCVWGALMLSCLDAELASLLAERFLRFPCHTVPLQPCHSTEAVWAACHTGPSGPVSVGLRFVVPCGACHFARQSRNGALRVDAGPVLRPRTYPTHPASALCGSLVVVPPSICSTTLSWFSLLRV
jgi:hypothetical protein